MVEVSDLSIACAIMEIAPDFQDINALLNKTAVAYEMTLQFSCGADASQH